MNKHCAWKEVKFKDVRYYLKGNTFFKNRLLSLEELTELIYPLICREDESQEKDLGTLLDGFNGEFAIVVETESRIFCAVDKFKKNPIILHNEKR